MFYDKFRIEFRSLYLVRNNTEDCLLYQKEEAKEWLVFLKEHEDKEELKTLENEMADRFFYKYDVQIS